MDVSDNLHDSKLPIRVCSLVANAEVHPGHRWSYMYGSASMPKLRQVVWYPGFDHETAELAQSGTLESTTEGDDVTDNAKYGPTPTSQGVRGYRDLTDAEIGEVNENKLMEEQVADRWAAVMGLDRIDKRWMAIARTHFQEGWSAMTRAVTRPDDPYAQALDNR